MTNTASDPFEVLIRNAGEGYLIDSIRPKASAMPHLRRRLEQAELARNRLSVNAPTLTPETLTDEYERNPHKVRAILQVLASASAEFLVMAWQILQGMEVASIKMEYDAQGTFKLRVPLSPPAGRGQSEEYESTDIDDAVVLRHLGIMKMNGQSFFDGFYALRLGNS